MRREVAGDWGIYESGANQAGYWASTDVWQWRIGTTLYYGHGADFHEAKENPDRTVSSVSGTLYFDSSLFGTGSKFEVEIYIPQNVLGNLFAGTPVFHTPTVTTSNTLTAARFDNSSTFYSATVLGDQALVQSARFNNSSSFYAATVTPGLLA